MTPFKEMCNEHHDGAATIALKAGAEMKVVQAMLGHSTYALTADTYTAVLPELASEAAEATARLISRRGTKRTPGLTSGSQGSKASKDATKKDREKGKNQQVKPAA
ncbi:hypothetical protein AB0869_22200 [Micromonospora vinacea]|uniref:hypothetical protein n=1 Tax=Micromonospora vinacea TaxID=709878 RepID=UPI0034559A0B